MIYEALAAVTIAIVGCLTTFTIWSRKETRIRGSAVILFLAAIPVVGATVLTALSNPAPCSIFQGGEYRVISAAMVEGGKIYLWLDLGEDRPRYCEIAWDDDLAERIQRLGRAERGGEIVGFRVDIPAFMPGEQDDPQVHPIPQPDTAEDKDEPQGYETYERNM